MTSIFAKVATMARNMLNVRDMMLRDTVRPRQLNSRPLICPIWAGALTPNARLYVTEGARCYDVMRALRTWLLRFALIMAAYVFDEAGREAETSNPADLCID